MIRFGRLHISTGLRGCRWISTPLTKTSLAQESVDEFVSAIWTERYSSAGDFQLVLPATKANIEMLAPGTFLALRGTNEIMIIETHSIEDLILTVTGRTLIVFLNERIAWFKNAAPGETGSDVTKRIVDFSDTTRKPGEFISNIVNMLVVPTPTSFPTPYFSKANLDWANDAIPNLSLGAIDTSGTAKRITMPIGPIYDGLEHIATDEGVGMSLYLHSADPIVGWTIKFKTYRGVDHSTGGAGALVRLTPNMDSLSDLKEIQSIMEYKNVVYVYYEGEITEHLAEPSLPEPEGFERRVMVTNAEGEPVGRKVSYGTGIYYSNYTVVGIPEKLAFREQHAKDALANHNYIRAIDGQTSPQNDYKYGVDYGLGDILELEGITGTLSKARVTEYIRTQDKIGEREYPTISVIE